MLANCEFMPCIIVQYAYSTVCKNFALLITTGNEIT